MMQNPEIIEDQPGVDPMQLHCHYGVCGRVQRHEGQTGAGHSDNESNSENDDSSDDCDDCMDSDEPDRDTTKYEGISKFLFLSSPVFFLGIILKQ
jgi:hypothetical protein